MDTHPCIGLFGTCGGSKWRKSRMWRMVNGFVNP